MVGDGWHAEGGAFAPQGQQAPILSRRSFLVGSAAGVGALGLAGCAT